MRRAPALVICGILLVPAAWSQDALSEGREALERGDARAAISAFKRAREEDPESAEACHHLGRAYEKAGKASDALLYYDAAAELAPRGIGLESATAARRLRRQWLEVELADANSLLERREYEEAEKHYRAAYRLAVPPELDARARATDGYVSAAAARFASEALRGLPKKSRVVVESARGVTSGTPGAAFAMALEEALISALRVAGGSVIAATERDSAQLLVAIRAGQRFTVKARAKGGELTATLKLESLSPPELARAGLPPEPLSLGLTLEGQRGDPRHPDTLQTFPVGDASIVRSRERLRLEVTVDRRAYVYAFLFDSAGEAILIYPGTEKLPMFRKLQEAGVKTTNPISPGRPLSIPPRDPLFTRTQYWFTLNHDVGFETIYVAAALVPLDDVEQLVKELQEAGEGGRAASQKLAAALHARSGGSSVGAGEDHVELIRGHGAAVRFVTFEHAPKE